MIPYPEHPDGTKYPFNCCEAPHVVGSLENGEIVCETCGYDWTNHYETHT